MLKKKFVNLEIFIPWYITYISRDKYPSKYEDKALYIYQNGYIKKTDSPKCWQECRATGNSHIIVGKSVKQNNQFGEKIWQLSYNPNCTPRYLAKSKETTHIYTKSFIQLFTEGFSQQLETENSPGVP